jgi:competence protein ComFC
LRAAILQLKYRGNIGLAETLAQPLIDLLTETGWEPDLVTVVPLGSIRGSERGFNQSSLLARPVALAHGLPLNDRILSRIRETRSQVGLSALERQINVEGAFSADPKFCQGRSILLIDDVFTTGSTLKACALAVNQAGASQVLGLTLARALPSEDIANTADIEPSEANL